MDIESKLADVGITIFSRMTQLALEHKAINLSQGFPDFEAPEALIDRVNHWMHKGANQYAPMQGVLPLRRNISQKIRRCYNVEVDPETQITITAGATEALYAAVAAVVRPQDEVIILEPAYDAYEPAVRLQQGLVVQIPLTYPDYSIDWDRVRDAVSARTRLLILNSPHNPTGTALDSRDIEALRGIAAENDILILSDEVYEHILFDNRVHQSMLRYPDLASRSFVVSSFGKTYHTTGWKVGYCVAPPALSDELRKVHQFITFAVNTPVQMAFADFLEHAEWYLGLSDFYQQKRDLFLEKTAGSRFKALPCAGTYFQMMDYSAISDEPDVVFANRLTTAFGVAAIPPSVFYHDRRDHHALRFCFAKQDQTLAQAAEILCRI